METTLERKAVSVTGLKSLTEESMMSEVKQILGYGGVDKALQLKQVADIFKSLDIEPFDDRKVQAYKKEMLAEQRKNSQRKYDYRRDAYYVTQWSWKRVLLSGYDNAVPAFALSRALEVKKALTAANIEGHFEVHELSSKTRKVYVDPFMVLVVGEHRFFIDVWDEPKFEGRRVK